MPDRLRPWIDSPATAGLFLDFDGTLAPIVDDPEMARPLPEARPALTRLSGRLALVAVVSGRPAFYLGEYLGGAGTTRLIGLYGLERMRGDPPVVEDLPEARPWREAVDTVAGRARTAAPPGVRVEHKGLTLTLHYRGADEQARWVDDFAAAEAATTGLVAHAGKKSVELRPPVATDKGSVIAELAGDLEAVCFIGDDAGDLPAFATLGRLRAAGRTTLAVAAGGSETPEEVLAGADVVVDGPAGVLALLQTMAGT